MNSINFINIINIINIIGHSKTQHIIKYSTHHIIMFMMFGMVPSILHIIQHHRHILNNIKHNVQEQTNNIIMFIMFGRVPNIINIMNIIQHSTPYKTHKNNSIMFIIFVMVPKQHTHYKHHKTL